MDEAAELPADYRPEGYTYLKKCGGGAYGTVWLVRDLSRRILVLKVVPRGPHSDRELGGLRAFCALGGQGKGIVEILHVGEDAHAFYYTMEPADNLEKTWENYVPATLENVLHARRMTPDEALNASLEILTGLALLHRNGLAHRDVKPANILLIRGHYCLGDVGLVASGRGEESLLGTRGFLTPELIREAQGGYKLEYDLYALGKVLYCMLSGLSVEHYPMFRLEESSHAFAMLNKLVLRLCDRDPAWRPKDIAELRRELELIRQSALPKRTAIKVRAALLIVAGAALLIAAAAGLWYPWRGATEKTAAKPCIATTAPMTRELVSRSEVKASMGAFSAPALLALLEHPLTPEAALWRDANGRSMLFYAVGSRHAGLIRKLIARGVPVDLQDCYGHTALHKALQHDDAATAELLLDLGASTNLRDGCGALPLHWAGRIPAELVSRMAAKGDVQVRMADGLTPLGAALRRNAGVEVVTALLDSGADVRTADAAGLTPLHEAVACGRMDLLNLLLKYGARPDAASATGLTPLHYCALYGRAEMAAPLIEKGARVNAHDRFGRTPLDYAERCKSFRTAAKLRGKGGVAGNAFAPEPAAGALRAKNRTTAGSIRACCGAEALNLAAARSNTGILRMLLCSGRVQANTPNFRWVPPLASALRRGAGTSTVAMLLRFGAHANGRLCDGETPLHLAVISGAAPATVKLLLDYGADPDDHGEGGESARIAAERLKRWELLPLFADCVPEKARKSEKNQKNSKSVTENRPAPPISM